MTSPAVHQQIELAGPPQRPESAPLVGSMGMIAVPAASGVGAVLLAVTQRDRPLFAAAGLLVLAASVVVGVLMAVGTRTGARRRLRTGRERYLDYLELRRQDAVSARARQLSKARERHPDPAHAAERARHAGQSWSRRPDDPDFLLVRVGLGTVPLDSPVALRFAPHDPLVEYDQVCVDAARELTNQYAVLGEQPVCLPLVSGPVAVIGPPARVRAVARALIAQLALAHSPSDVAVLVCSPGGQRPWEWVKWLPHAHSAGRFDGPLAARLVAAQTAEAIDLAAAEIGADRGPAPGPPRRLVVILDRLEAPTAADAGVDQLVEALKHHGAHQVHLVQRGSAKPAGCISTVTTAVDDHGPGLVEHLGATADDPTSTTRCRLDQLDESAAEALARALAPLRAPGDGNSTENGTLVGDPQLPVGDPAAVDPARDWRHRDVDLLRAPIGVDAAGAPLLLDLKEAARGGMGPHGLVVGATGSGKSELLRTLVLALAVRHPPLTMALLLVDFKGGATFSGLTMLPHVAGTITNLQDDLTMVDRFRQALAGELLRRQEVLAAAGNLNSVEEYAALGGPSEREPMPRLLVIVDEFSELLGAKPELADLFVTIGRIGRSIGIHLLLATQRLDTGRLRGLESHLSYRICLRTFSESESREAIGTPAAYHLGREPGAAYLRAAGPELRRFRVAMVSGPYRITPTDVRSAMVLPYPAVNGVPALAAALRAGAGSDARIPGRTVLQIAVQRLMSGSTQLSRPARRIWLDPLPTRLEWTDLPPTTDAPAGGSPAEDRVRAGFGVIDIPERQEQVPLEWECTTGNAHLLVVGAGRSGKSTAIRALLVALCRRCRPGDLAIYCVDFGGETLVPLGSLPQVAAVATRDDPDLTRKVFTRVHAALDERAALLRGSGCDGVAGLRAARRSGDVDPAVPGDVLLVVDGWSAVAETDPQLDTVLDDILARGSGLGVHLLLTAAGPARLRTRLLAGFGRRIELRLSDPFDSAVDRRLAAALPADVPGRALVAGGHYAQIVLPGPVTTDSVAAGDPVPRVRTLPARIGLEELLVAAPERPAAAPRPLWLGLADADLAPVPVDPAGSDRHLVIYGDPRSGKTTLLRALLSQLTDDTGSTGQDGGVAVYVIDYRRRLTDRRAGLPTAVDTAGASAMCAAIAVELAARSAAAPAGPASTCTAPPPDLVLLVDDYEIVCGAAGPGGNPLLPLLPHLVRAGELGFRLLIARTSGGAGRARYEPVLQALTDLGGPVVLFSGPAAEGRLAHDTAPIQLPAGRALLAIRGRTAQLIQAPWMLDPTIG